jgi:histidine kinase-like protein
VPVPSNMVIGRPDGDISAGCQWLRAAAEMAGMACGDRFLSPGAGAPSGTRSPITTQTLNMDAEAVRAGREFCIATLRRWRATQRCEDITIVVSELLTNALRHAVPGLSRNPPNWPVRLGLLCSEPCVLCAVADPSSSIPVPKKPGHLAETGRGLHVVSSLSDKWGYTTYTTPSDAGKVVWAIFMTVPAPRDSRDAPAAQQKTMSATGVRR